MRSALSNILGEYVEAGEIAHADTTDFQVVCPCCRESVLKVERGGRRAGHYFSHRRTTPETLECERRVASIPDREKERTNALARGQALSAFQAVLPAMIALERVGYPGGVVERTHEEMLAIAGSRLLSERLAEVLAEPGSGDAVRIARLAAHVLASMERQGVVLTTGLSRAFQERIACGLHAHLTVPQARPSLAFAVRHVLIGHAKVLASPRRIELPPERHDAVLAAHATLRERDPNRARMRLAALARPGPAGGGASALGTLAGMVEVEIMSLLCRLPYREMMANLARGRPPLDGIAPMEGTRMGVARAAPDVPKAVLEAVSGAGRAPGPSHALSLHLKPRAR